MPERDRTAVDGTLTSSNGPRKIISVGGRPGFAGVATNPYGLLTAECQSFVTGNISGYAVCPDHDFRALGVTYPIDASFSNPDWRIDVVREGDGNRVTPDHFRWISYVVPGQAYKLEVKNKRNLNDATVYGLEKLTHVELGLSTGDLSVPTLLTGARNTVYDAQWTARSIMVSAVAPAAGKVFVVRRCAYQAGSECPGDTDTWPVIAQAASLSALQASTQSGYFVDTASGRIVFKFFGGDRLRIQ
jgi:hypothetical protein